MFIVSPKLNLKLLICEINVKGKYAHRHFRLMEQRNAPGAETVLNSPNIKFPAFSLSLFVFCNLIFYYHVYGGRHQDIE
jgi:hypothetical protein